MSTAHSWGNLAPNDHRLPSPTAAVPGPLGTGACDTPGVVKAQERVAVREIRNWGEEMLAALENRVMAGCELRQIGLEVIKL